MSKTIEVKDLKKYFGKTRAVDGVSFSVYKGEVFGFLGPNGAGKTTTIRCMMDFIRPTAGQITILGQDAQKNSVELKRSMGYLGPYTQLYNHLNGEEHIKLLEGISGQTDFDEELTQKLLFDRRTKVKKLSTGNRQKLNFILALMHKPKVLILDEPTVGLDPLLQQTVYKTLLDLKKKGATIFMSSHYLHEVEQICDRVGIIKEGQMVAVESMSDLRKKHMYKATIDLAEKYHVEDFQIQEMKIINHSEKQLIIQIKGNINPLIKAIAKYKVKDIQIERASLDEIFMEYYQK